MDEHSRQAFVRIQRPLQELGQAIQAAQASLLQTVEAVVADQASAPAELLPNLAPLRAQLVEVADAVAACQRSLERDLASRPGMRREEDDGDDEIAGPDAC